MVKNALMKKYDEKAEISFLKLELSNALERGDWRGAIIFLYKKKIPKKDARKILDDHIHTEEVEKAFKKYYE